MQCLVNTSLQHIFSKWTQISAGYISNSCLFDNCSAHIFAHAIVDKRVQCMSTYMAVCVMNATSTQKLTCKYRQHTSHGCKHVN